MDSLDGIELFFLLNQQLVYNLLELIHAFFKLNLDQILVLANQNIDLIDHIK